MASRSLHCDANPRRKRSFTLPSFRAAPAVNAEVHGVGGGASSAAKEAGARLSMAAAWQWHTRGLGDLVVPTRRPFSSAAAGAAYRLNARHDQKQQHDVHHPPRRRVLPPSRFKAEASARAPSTGAPPPSPTPPAPSAPALFDHLELSGLESQMSDFLQHLHQKSRPLAAAPVSGNDGLTHPLHRPAGGVSEGFASRRPISALHRLLRKAFSVFLSKNAKEPRRANPSTAVEEPVEAPLGARPEPEDVQYHYHHYIHHHHHHHHYRTSPEKRANSVRRRRHSESNCARPPVGRSVWKEIMIDTDTEEEEQEEEGVEEGTPISALLACRRARRHSDSAFVGYSVKGDASAMDWPDQKEAFANLPELQLPIRQLSERFPSNKIPIVSRGAELGESGRQCSSNIRDSKRHSTESFREEEMANVRWGSMGLRMAEERTGGRDGVGVYRLGGGAGVGGGGGRADISRRRHAESFGRRRVELFVCE